MRGLVKHLPLYTNCLNVIVDIFKASGANPEIGTALLRVFVEAGLPPPTMRIEIMLGAHSEFTEAPGDILKSLEPQARRNGVSLEPLGDLSTLGQRLQDEVHASNDVISWLAGSVGAWCKTPVNTVAQ